MEIKCEICDETVAIFSSEDFEIKSNIICGCCYHKAKKGDSENIKNVIKTEGIKKTMKIQIDKDGSISYEGDFPECDGVNCHHSGKGLLIPYVVQHVSYQPIYGYHSVPELRWKCNRCGKII